MYMATFNTLAMAMEKVKFWIPIASTVIFYVILPSVDVYGDISLALSAASNGYPSFAIALVAPAVLNTVFQCFAFWRIEENKKSLWILVLLQVIDKEY